METGEKKCPKCAETVKAEAGVCPHCRHRLANYAATLPTIERAGYYLRQAGFGLIGCGCLVALGGVALMLLLSLVMD